MELKGRTCGIQSFSIDQAVVKTKQDSTEITNAFQEELTRHLGNAGLSIQEMGSGISRPDITVQGQFIQIDEGSRWMRYFLTFFAGKAVVEIEGKLLLGDTPITDFYAKATQSAGLFGGSSKGLLKLCAKSAAKKASKSIIKDLKAR